MGYGEDTMKILAVSDSHGKTDTLRAVYEKVKPVDLFLHMGDCEGDESEIESFISCRKEFVCGNCDFFCPSPEEKVIRVCGKKILLVHGHIYHVHRGLDTLRYRAAECEADIVLFGHTHVPLIKYLDGRLFLNPGSITLPRQDGRRPTFGILETDRNGEVLPSVWTLTGGKPVSYL